MLVNEISKSNKLMKYFSYAISKDLFWILAFTTLTAFAAQVSVPVQPVPFTLQTMLVILSGAFLGSRNGAISQIIYLFVGIIGIPVFANMSFGLPILFGPTGGYLLSFPIAAFIVGFIIERKRNLFTIISSMVLASLIVLIIGAAYLTTFYSGNFKQAFFAGAIIFSVWDLIKISAAVSMYHSFSKKYPKLPK
ncbi:MAG: biotin transporter BioY [Ignavibacteriales bacterium]|nr:biotin transporter BioY [Ignavibacteriales bacterium]